MEANDATGGNRREKMGSALLRSRCGERSLGMLIWRSVVSIYKIEKLVRVLMVRVCVGNLMLAIQARSFSNYFYLSATNKIQPPPYIGNKVSGILFEDKIDHASMLLLSSQSHLVSYPLALESMFVALHLLSMIKIHSPKPASPRCRFSTFP